MKQTPFCRCFLPQPAKIGPFNFLLWTKDPIALYLVRDCMTIWFLYTSLISLARDAVIGR